MLEQVLICLLGLGAYAFGAVIRLVAVPPHDPLPRKTQLLLALPTSIGVVGPLLGVLNSVASDGTPNLASTLSTLGVILEHGFFFHEALTKLLARLLVEATQSERA